MIVWATATDFSCAYALRARKPGSSNTNSAASAENTPSAHIPARAPPGDSLPEWLRHGRLSLSQARAIAGNWKDARRAGHDPVAEWEAQLARERKAGAAKKAAEETAETAHPSVRQAIDTFMARHMAGRSVRGANASPCPVVERMFR
ncbi:protein of unknown function [Methylococcus capsulatus]|uniref:Uncharacterized protein n=1 Tax=Methylococcus capsulatus TaxID=414 RepID=A0AA35UTK9_METCP|nr:protein of unknown function [Methylococcus capsulatus]